MLVEEPGSGLGLLRSERPESVSFSELPPTVRQKALEPRLLIVTKANRRSTVHRPVYLDYVGVKMFDRAGTGRGRAPLHRAASPPRPTPRPSRASP